MKKLLLGLSLGVLSLFTLKAFADDPPINHVFKYRGPFHTTSTQTNAHTHSFSSIYPDSHWNQEDLVEMSDDRKVGSQTFAWDFDYQLTDQETSSS